MSAVSKSEAGQFPLRDFRCEKVRGWKSSRLLRLRNAPIYHAGPLPRSHGSCTIVVQLEPFRTAGLATPILPFLEGCRSVCWQLQPVSHDCRGMAETPELLGCELRGCRRGDYD
jgi:hypothetical protein